MADEFHGKALRGLCCVCDMLIFLNGQEIFNHPFDVINMPTQISYTCLRAGKKCIVKIGARDSLFRATSLIYAIIN